MVLNKGECVLCNGKAEQFAVADILKENGYKMFSDDFDLYCFPSDGEYRGFRWFTNHEFPACIATMSSEMINSVREDGTISDDEGIHRFYCMSFEEFMDRCSYQPLIGVEDLI